MNINYYYILQGELFMKKALAKIVLGITCLSSVYTFGATTNVPTTVKKMDNSITTYGGTGWVGGYGDTKENRTLYVMGEKMPAKVEIFIRDGLFMLSDGETNWKLSVNESSNSGIFFSTFGCDLINTPSWDISSKGHKYSTLLRIQGEGSQSESRTLTLTAALDLLRTGAVSISVPGFGEVSGESELKAAFGGAVSKTISVTMDTGYKSYHGADFTVEGFENIDFTLD